MPGMKEIKNRINSVSDTQKITNAMYMIASTKLRKAKQDMDNTRPYFESLRSEIARILYTDKDLKSRYLKEKPETGTYGYLVITADKGLAGPYNHNMIKKMLELTKEHEDNKLFVIGEVGRRYCEVHGIPHEENFRYSAKKPSFRRADEIGKIVFDRFDKGELAALYIVYTDIKNSVTEVVRCDRLLPFKKELIEDSMPENTCEFEFIPSPAEMIDRIMPEYLTGYIFSALVDSYCAEENARMMAMDAANTNAEEIRQELMLEYNHLRQNAITQEITEVAAGAKAKRRKMEREILKKKKKESVV
ncbi:MAG: ATP synthase F1 subunit gamma [Lachnospiraceae bacterium]|nr:ATP synthase F1 subunit gamma [Lachnospiraceae bacterium]